MSIKTPGQLEGDNFKTDPTVAGFVKNDSSGNFQFGQTGSAWTFLETKTLASAATSIAFTGLANADNAYRLVWENPFDVGTPAITDGRIYFHYNGLPTGSTESVITNLDGDVDDTYQVMWQFCAPSTGGNTFGFLTLNGSTAGATTRYVSQSTWNTGMTPGLGAGFRLWREFGSTSKGGIYGRAIIHAKSGKVRTGYGWSSAQRIFSGNLRTFEYHAGFRWNDTTTNLTSL